MKLKALHLFLILLGSLILCCILGEPLREGMSNKGQSQNKDQDDNDDSENSYDHIVGRS